VFTPAYSSDHLVESDRADHLGGAHVELVAVRALEVLAGDLTVLGPPREVFLT
jgi:hypothetical protein